MLQLTCIQVVDGDAVRRDAVRRALRDHGHEVVAFASAPEGLDAWRTQRFDLVLVDLALPGTDGTAFLGQVRLHDPAVVGIVMSAAWTPATALAAMKAGAFDCIATPFKAGDLLPALARALGVRQLRLDHLAAQHQLRERETQVAEMERELAALSYAISHDLGAPVRLISGFAGVLQRNHAARLPEEARELLGYVTDNTRLMGRMIEDLLRFSRLGRQALTRRQVEVGPLVAQVVGEQRAAHPGREIEVRVGNLPDCTADPALLAQVFAALLDNAFKFTAPRERALVTVDGEPGDGEVVYTVGDNGIGFDMQYADRLFGMFKRLHGSDRYAGTGVGLSIAQRIVRRHGGRMWADAEVDGGAQFHVALPA